jgi:hypothetical protein
MNKSYPIAVCEYHPLVRDILRAYLSTCMSDSCELSSEIKKKIKQARNPRFDFEGHF